MKIWQSSVAWRGRHERQAWVGGVAVVSDDGALEPAVNIHPEGWLGFSRLERLNSSSGPSMVLG